MKIILTNREAGLNPSSKELSEVIISRMGLEPRKKGSTDKMFLVLLELYERAKLANREKKPEAAILTVEEMAFYAGISRQTMYSYLDRWLILDFITKTTYIKEGKVIIGYRLNGLTIDAAFEKSIQKINNNLKLTQEYIKELQRIIKNEKISRTATKYQKEFIPIEKRTFDEKKEDIAPNSDRPLE